MGEHHHSEQSRGDRGRAPFYYILGVTLVSMALIAANEWLNLGIPFTVHFLVGIVAALLIFVALHAALTKGWRRALSMFALSFCLTFSAEALGVNFGLVFGRYHYTDFLGVGLFGVPFLAALAWEPILYAAFSLAENLANARHPPQLLGFAAAGALATTAWDMMIDPIAVHQGWWAWLDGGPYVADIENGVPISNFLGWLGVSFVVMLLYRLILPGGGDRPAPDKPYLSFWGPLTLYAALFLTAAGVALTILERPEVALVGLMAMGPFLALAGMNASMDAYRAQSKPATSD
ncbi:MAG: carotenoid biosynthesis protein [Anaerolineales bacterium]|nr:carotenoid biosynthesis protein [Anaerolineales bacterium]